MSKATKLFSVALLFLCGSVNAQQLINCAPATPCTLTGPQGTGTGDKPYLSFGKANANFTQLYGYFSGQLVVLPSGDTTGVTDQATLTAAIAGMAATFNLPPSYSSYAVKDRIVLGPGTFYLTSSMGNILGSVNTLKITGIWLQGSGRGVTNIDYNPSSCAPLFVNNHALDFKVSDMTFLGHSSAPLCDFLWSQEQAGISNVQDFTYQDVDFAGTWNILWRLTGGNNNSEWKLSRTTGAGNFNMGFYTPPAVATIISNGSSTIASTNTAEQVEVGDTGTFDAAVAPLSSSTSYYVVSASTTGFQVATSFGGTPVSFTASGTPNFYTASDQFLNFWLDKFKWDTGTSLGQLFVMNYGGSIKIHDMDISGHSPSSVAYVFNLLATLNGPHNSGVMNFEADGVRVEHSNNNSRLIHSQWSNGSISFNNLDESSQAGNRTITNAYAFYEIVNNNGPIISYSNSQLMGVHNYTNNVNNYTKQNDVEYQNVTLLDNPTFANFITMSNVGNTGGYPVIHCDNCRNSVSSATAGYKEVVDTDLNWQYAQGRPLHVRSVPCLGTNSDWPQSGGNFELRFPLNSAIVQTRYWKPANANSGAFQYTIQSTEGTPTVIAGGAATPMAGSNAGAAVTLYTTYGADGSVAATSTPFVMGTDAARTINILDSSGTRSGIFTGLYCLIDYIGKDVERPANDDLFSLLEQRVA